MRRPMTMADPVRVVRCPRCGSMDAESVEPIHVEFDRMKCNACGHQQICDEYSIRFTWNADVPADQVRRDVWFVLPDDRFEELWRSLGAEGSGREVYELVCAAYAEPSRAYHTARHIGACLRLIDDPAVRMLASCAPEVEAALWFHDVIYDTRARDNEARSAELAEGWLRSGGVAAGVAARVAEHIRATSNHLAPSGDGQLVVDIDLSILGEDPDTYARFEAEVRREYAWVDAEAYRSGRAAVLGRFLARPSIYATPWFRERYEASARENMTASLARLGGGLVH